MKNRKMWTSLICGILAGLMVLGMIAGLLPTPASAASSSEIRDQINKLKEERKGYQSEIKKLESQLSGNVTEMEKIVTEKNIIDQEVFLLHEQVENINKQISAFAVLIADKQDELDAAQARLDALNEKYKERIRTMEEQGKLSYWSVLFKANSFSDLLDRLNMVQEIAAADRRRLKEMSEVAKEVAAAKEDLAAEKADLEQTQLEQAETEVKLQEKRKKADELLQELKARNDEFEAMIDEGEALVEELTDEIAQSEKDYTAAKRKEYLEWLATSEVPTTKPKPTEPGKPEKPGKPDNGGDGGSSGGEAPSVGGWKKPTKYVYVSSPYGWRIHPVYHYKKFHSGVDLAAREGTPIVASRSGVVTRATYNSSSGYYVTINHGDGFSTSYLHMTHFVVKEGQRVSAGETIGYVGSTGVSTGAHLHFTMYYNGSTVNPADYIKF